MNTLTTLPKVNTILDELLASQKKELFENLLRSTNREGIESVIAFLNNTDFYTAPSSASYHSNYQGGLLDNVLLVYSTAMRYRSILLQMQPDLEERLPEDSVIISALLHDVCKTCFYKQTQKWRKDANGAWESYIGYEIEDTFPIGHGEKSVIMLQNFGLKLTADEMLAIRFHMGSWDGALLTNDVKFSYQNAMNKCPLMTVIQNADSTSSLLFEKQNIN